MRLTEALRVKPGQVIAFVGAGGKSTAIAKLTQELIGESPVVITATTKLGREQASLAHEHLAVSGSGQLGPLPNLLQSRASVLVTRGPDPKEPKLLGVGAEILEELRGIVREAGATLLVEADGARGLSLKAPAPHEPVIPDSADLVVPLTALDVVGAPLDEANVHRPELVAKLLGLRLGARIEADHLAALVASPSGGMRGVPPGAAVRVLLNKADTDDRLAAGRAIAERALVSPRINSVLIGAVAHKDPVIETHGRVAGVVLAGGGSERLGCTKQLVRWRGKTLVEHAVQAAREGGLSPIVVVVGADAEAVRREVASQGVGVIENPAWREGQSRSVVVGLAAVESRVEAAMFLLSDVPFMDGRLVRALVAEHRRSLAPLIAPTVEGQRATPVLFDRVVFPELQKLQGDQGGRVLFDRFPSLGVEWHPDILFDVDTPDDLRALEMRA